MKFSIQNLNLKQFETVVTEAKAKAANNPSWVRAIVKAETELLTNPYWSFDGHFLTILSATSDTIYRINGCCADERQNRCKGAEFNNNCCYHRAMKRLIVRYLEIKTAADVAA